MAEGIALADFAIAAMNEQFNLCCFGFLGTGGNGFILRAKDLPASATFRLDRPAVIRGDYPWSSPKVARPSSVRSAKTSTIGRCPT